MRKNFEESTEYSLRERTFAFLSLSSHSDSRSHIRNVSGKVRNHCHLNGNYLSAAFSEGSLDAKKPKLVSLNFQNHCNCVFYVFLEETDGMKEKNVECDNFALLSKSLPSEL